LLAWKKPCASALSKLHEKKYMFKSVLEVPLSSALPLTPLKVCKLVGKNHNWVGGVAYTYE